MALVIHVHVILGVGFAPRERDEAQQRSLDVVLANRPSTTAPEDARFVAESDQHGADEIPEALPAAPSSDPVNALGEASRTRLIDDLSAEIDQRLTAFEARPRRKWITARTREHAYAAYMEAWRKTVERIGNLNYPPEARSRGLSGSLSLDVALNADGTVAGILLRRSSGEKVLDEAAKRIVELAAPFAEFPPAIRAEVDILHIERTWRFSSGNRLDSP